MIGPSQERRLLSYRRGDERGLRALLVQLSRMAADWRVLVAAKIIRVGLAVLFLLGFLPPSEAAASETVILATSPNPLLARRTDEGMEGFLALLMGEAFRRMGRKLEIRLMPWARCIEEARTGEVDGVFALFHTPDRDPDFLFTDEALSVQTEVFFARRDDPVAYDGKLASLAGKKVAVINYGKQSPRLRQALADGWLSENVAVNTLESAAGMLAGGRVDLVPAHREVFLAILREQHLSGQIVELSPPIEEVNGYLALTRRKDLRDVAQAFDEALRGMKADGSYDALHAATFK